MNVGMISSCQLRDIETNSPLKGHWQQKISSFYIKVFNLNSQNIAV